MELTDGLGADVAFEAVGVPETFELATEHPGGDPEVTEAQHKLLSGNVGWWESIRMPDRFVDGQGAA